MSIEAPHSDADLLDLLRITGALRITEMAEAMEVTPTAVRQRLIRMMTQGLIQREPIRAGRGRPLHKYWLTDKGLRQSGTNFNDLAVALWREVRAIPDGELRRSMLRRVARALAAGYAGQVHGETPAERMRSLGELLSQRRIPASVEETPKSMTLTAHACPYPNLAEQDQGICTVERMMFSELVGQDVHLTQCRLEGGADCRFQAR
jgi:predicted ArsR family transcriptional regulator